MAQPTLFSPVHRVVVAVLAPRLPPRAVVLDVGCGTGRLLERLRQARPDITTLGIDRSAGMLGAARHLRPHLGVERGSAEALPHPDGRFDAVTTTISFHHWSDKPAALREVVRVLRPGGIFALTDVSVDDIPDRPRSLFRRAREHMGDMPTLDARHGLLDDAGFRVTEVRRTLHGRWVPLTVAERPA